MYKKILVAYNGTVEGRAALHECVTMIGHGNVDAQPDIHLLVVVNLAPYLMGGDFVAESAIVAERQLMEQELAIGKQILIDGGLSASTYLEAGEPVQVIRKLADQLQVDLLIVAHSRKKGMATRWWKTAVDTSLVEAVSCSMLVVAATAPDDEKPGDAATELAASFEV